ncbi:MAG: helix-turn-helix domain-containing protein [Treponemataceae bacterium]
MNKNVDFYTASLKEMTAKLSAILSVEDIAKFLRVSPKSVYNLILTGELSAFKVPNEHGYNIYKKDFISFLQKNETINF